MTFFIVQILLFSGWICRKSTTPFPKKFLTSLAKSLSTSISTMENFSGINLATNSPVVIGKYFCFNIKSFRIMYNIFVGLSFELSIFCKRLNMRQYLYQHHFQYFFQKLTQDLHCCDQEL